MPDSKRFLHPEAIKRIARLDLRARHVVEGFLSGMHRSPVLRPVDRVPPAPRVHLRRRSALHRLEGLGQAGPLLRQAVRGRHQPPRHAAGRRLRQHALRPRADEQVRIRLHDRRAAWPTCCCGSRTPWAAWPSTTPSAMTVPLRTKRNHLELDHPGPGSQQPARTRPTCYPILRDVAETYPRRGMMVLVSDLLVDAARACSAG